MARRLYQDSLGGRLDADAASGATSLSSPAFASMVAVTGSDELWITVDPDGTGGAPEYVKVTAHTASATTVTCVATSRALKNGDHWVHGPLARDMLVLTGAGTPEGAVTAAVGTLYTRTDGGAGTTLYVKESGAGNTGWVAK